MKGLTPVMYLVIAMAVMAGVGILVMFAGNQGINTQITGSQNAACTQAIVSVCQSHPEENVGINPPSCKRNVSEESCSQWVNSGG